MRYKIIILVIGVILLSSLNFGQDNQHYELEDVSQPTITKVYVKMPNFKVIDEDGYGVMTIIKNAEIPESYEGALIQLQTEDLEELINAIKNLKTEKVVIFREDNEVAVRLDEIEFLSVEII
ncbi:MAG: hypothetical protein KAK00_02890 [Nanoarchaeota archaeon]|nr:hypothetical protein [Nanoarchaeota archaeon]